MFEVFNTFFRPHQRGGFFNRGAPPLFDALARSLICRNIGCNQVSNVSFHVSCVICGEAVVLAAM